MGPQREKTSKPRRRIEDSENPMQIPHAPKENANRVYFQKNKIALEDLTNKSVTTPMKSMGNAADKEGDPGSDEQQSINKFSGRQTRSKVKSILSLNPMDNYEKPKKVPNNDELLKTLTETEYPMNNIRDAETVGVGTNLSNAGKCSRQTRQTAKECTSSSQHSTFVGRGIPNNGSPIGKSVRSSPTDLHNMEAINELENSKNYSKREILSTVLPGLGSQLTLEDVSQNKRQTRNMVKSQNISTLSNAAKPKEVSLKSSAQNAKIGPHKMLCRPTESQIINSPPLKCHKSPPSRKMETATTKVPKVKRKTALEKWIEQAAEVSLIDGSSSSPGTCRKSARLSVSKLSSTNLTSPKSDPKVTSPRSATKRTVAAAKKVPVWKTEPKPEHLHSAADDVYGFEYDASECKPAKKKRTRKPKKEDDVFKARKGTVALKKIKRLPRGVKVQATEESVMKDKIRTKPLQADKDAANDATPLLNAVAEKLKQITDNVIIDDDTEKEVGLDDHSYIYPIADQLVNVYDVTLPENVDAEHEVESNEKDKYNESGVLAGEWEETGQSIPSHISQVEAEMENLFGFEDAENDPTASTMDKTVEKRLVRSTPIKQSTIAESFVSMSPVRKVAKATRKSVNRPARIDEQVARDLIRGIRPLHPAMDKQKSTTLMQYIKDVSEGEQPDEGNDESTINVPPTPPTVFTQPPRRSYSKRELRTVKRTIFQDDDDEAHELSDEEDAAPKKSKKRIGGKTVHKKNKRDEEEEQWYKVMNSHFQDVDKFNLSS